MKRSLCITLLLLLIGCAAGNDSARIPPVFEVHALEVPPPLQELDGTPQGLYDSYLDTPDLYYVFKDGTKTYYLCGSDWVFHSYWHDPEMHPYWPWKIGEMKAVYVWLGPEHQETWLPAKYHPITNKIVINPHPAFHELTHHWNRITAGAIEDPHNW